MTTAVLSVAITVVLAIPRCAQSGSASIQQAVAHQRQLCVSGNALASR
jgi:hypothetical protein